MKHAVYGWLWLYGVWVYGTDSAYSVDGTFCQLLGILEKFFIHVKCVFSCCVINVRQWYLLINSTIVCTEIYYTIVEFQSFKFIFLLLFFCFFLYIYYEFYAYCVVVCLLWECSFILFFYIIR